MTPPVQDPDRSEGELQKRRTMKKPFQNMPSHLNISTPTDSSTPGQDVSSSSTDDSHQSQHSNPFPTPSIRHSRGVGLLRTHKVPPVSKHMQPPVSQDVSVGEVAPRVGPHHHSVGEVPSKIRVLLEPPDKHTKVTAAMSPGEVAISSKMRHRKTMDGVDIITLGSAQRHQQLRNVPGSSVSVGEVVSHQDDTLASLDSTVQLVHSGENGAAKRAEDEQRSPGKIPKSDTDKGETVKIQSEEEIKTDYQTDTFTSMGLTQESSDFPMMQPTVDEPQTQFTHSLHVELVKEGGEVKGRAVTKEAEVKDRQEAKEGTEGKRRSVTEEGQLQDGDSSPVPAACQEDTFQLSATPSLESTRKQSPSEGDGTSMLEVKQRQENTVPSSTDDFILTASGSDTTTLSF